MCDALSCSIDHKNNKNYKSNNNKVLKLYNHFIPKHNKWKIFLYIQVFEKLIYELN